MAEPDTVADDLCVQALELPPDQRDTFLDRACQGQPTLRQQVNKLLRAVGHVDDALDSPPPPPTTPRDLTGQVIAGRYTLVRRLGRGGMGEVWEGEQTQPVRRRVAVKLIRRDFGGADILTRFAAERQAIALMDHPHIAKLLEAGATDDGDPYFVMEVVHGRSLTAFCDEKKLPLFDRLRLFQQVCAAVQHAHQKGVIHRDLKPSNVLVEEHDGKPVAKVIDFGLVKAAGGLRLTSDTLVTAYGAVMGTPLYMAPEQALPDAADVDTRADVFALGAMLFELLTGTTPLAWETVKDLPVHEVVRLVREQEAPAPSRRLTEGGRHARLRELDWITLKALSKERERRYESAAALSADVQRYLDHEPVLAGPPSVAYRAAKFARRHRGPVTASALLLLALLGGFGGTAWGLVQAEEKRQEADQARERERVQKEIAQANEATAIAAKNGEAAERAEAEKAYTRIAEVLRDMTSDVAGQSLATQRRVSPEQQRFLTRVLDYYRELSARGGNDETSRVRAADAAFAVGLIEFRLGRRPAAATAFGEARDRFARLAADHPGVPAYHRRLANSHTNLGNLLALAERRVEAREEYERGRKVLDRLLVDRPDDPDARAALALAHFNLGAMSRELGEHDRAVNDYLFARTLQERLTADHPTNPTWRKQLAGTHNALGLLAVSRRKFADAETHYAAALSEWEHLTKDFPADPDHRADLARTHNEVGFLLTQADDPKGARALFEEAVTGYTRLTADYPAVPAYRVELARTQFNFGVFLKATGQDAEAVAAHRAALALRMKLVAQFPDDPLSQLDLAHSHNSMGLLYESEGERAKARAEYEQAVAIHERLAATYPSVPEFRNALGVAYNNLGVLHTGDRKWADAEVTLKKAVGVRKKLADDFPTTTGFRINLGDSFRCFGVLRRDQGRAADSLESFDRAVATLREVCQRNPRDPGATALLQAAFRDRATARDLLFRHTEAVADWTAAIDLSPTAQRPKLRAWRATSRAAAGELTEAVTEVADLTAASDWDAVQWYEFARVYSTAAPKSPGKEAEYGDRAIELLGKAVAAGFGDPERLKRDKEFDRLRDRDDFKKLLAAVEKRATPSKKD